MVARIQCDSRTMLAGNVRQTGAVTCAVETNRLNLILPFSLLVVVRQMLFYSNIFITLSTYIYLYCGRIYNNNVVQIGNLPEIFYWPSDEFSSDRIQITHFRSLFFFFVFVSIGFFSFFFFHWEKQKKKKKKLQISMWCHIAIIDFVYSLYIYIYCAIQQHAFAKSDGAFTVLNAEWVWSNMHWTTYKWNCWGCLTAITWKVQSSVCRAKCSTQSLMHLVSI